MKLHKVRSVEIIPVTPFNFDATFHKPDHFTSGDNIWEKGIRWQTWQWRGKCLGLKFINKGKVNNPRIILEIYFTENLDQKFVESLVEEIGYLYNFSLDLIPFYEKFRSNKILGPVIRKWNGLRPGQPSSLYEYLIIGIVLQNASVRRSIQMFRSLLENYGTLLEYDDKELWCFWKPGGLRYISEQELRDLKMGYRARSIKKVDDYFRGGLINEYDLREKPVEIQKEELLKIYGIGPATVWYILFDVFHRWDTFEHVSPWEQKIYTKLFFNKDPEDPYPAEKILKFIARFSPYRALAVHYLWEDIWWQRKSKKIDWLERYIHT